MEVTIILLSLFIVISAQIAVSSSYARYKRMATTRQRTGESVARQMLDENSLNDIKIERVPGKLSDHYDPRKKVVRLSSEIYSGTSVAALAVAAHEVGHAIQDKDNYSFMRIRASLVPVVNFASILGYISIVIGLSASWFNLITIGIIAQLVILFFHIVTLPVEFNATARAKKYLSTTMIVDKREFKAVKKMLNAAAFTYIASVMANLLQLLRLVLIRGRRNN